MSTREQFGKYLLLKKLAEDPLGETFRAGMLGAKGMERVALLRILNGQGLDGQRLWAACQGRAAIQQNLRSPNIGDGIEMGEVQGIPYFAYDYVSGKNLATLFEQATKQRSPIATDHALLITERLALALSVAAEHRFNGERILHGFLVPHLVMISNEGEARLLGFELGPALRGFVGNPVLRRHFGRYLAPEALAGAVLERSDDIYSLGVLLFELLTGQTLPPPTGDGYAELIKRSTLASEDKPLPAGCAQLLTRSLVPREHRMNDIAEWQKTLAAWMTEGHYNPTTFNLAFYMHNLYRQDIEQESQEIEVEKTLPVPIAGGPRPPVTAPATGSIPVQADADSSGAQAVFAAPPPSPPGAGADTGGGPAPAGSKTGLMIGIAAALLLALAGVLWWTLGRGGDMGPDSVAAGRADGALPAAQGAAQSAGLDPGLDGEPSAGISPEGVAQDGEGAADTLGQTEGTGADAASEAQVALQAKIDSLVADKASAMETQLRAQMDQQLERLRSQLRETEAAAAAREKQVKAEREAAEAKRQAEIEAAKKAQEDEAAQQAEEAAAQKAAEEAAKPTIRRGDLVETGPGIIPPRLVRFPPPHFPAMALRLNRTDVTVPVRVLVDENGKVLEAKPASEKEFGFGFDAEALSVARGAVYKPATAEGVPVKMWVTLRIRFK